jgi:hypothetical protein
VHDQVDRFVDYDAWSSLTNILYRHHPEHNSVGFIYTRPHRLAIAKPSLFYVRFSYGFIVSNPKSAKFTFFIAWRSSQFDKSLFIKRGQNHRDSAEVISDTFLSGLFTPGGIA